MKEIQIGQAVRINEKIISISGAGTFPSRDSLIGCYGIVINKDRLSQHYWLVIVGKKKIHLHHEWMNII